MELCEPGTVRVWLRSWLVAEVGVVLDGDEVVLAGAAGPGRRA